MNSLKLLDRETRQGERILEIDGKEYTLRSALTTREIYEMAQECTLRLYVMDTEVGVLYKRYTWRME